MLRQLLTLLALITGLAASAAPAHAMAADGRERVEIASTSAVTAHAQVLERLQVDTTRVSGENRAEAVLPPALRLAIPSALVGIDRARE